MKLLSTPDDYGRAIGEGLRALMDEHAIASGAVTRIVHATTVATNAILEGKGARTALITTVGCRDVLEMRRLRIPEMYTLNYQKPDPLGAAAAPARGCRAAGARGRGARPAGRRKRSRRRRAHRRRRYRGGRDQLAACLRQPGA